MTKEGSAKIVNFITIGAGGLMLGRGYMSEYALSSTLSIYITLIDIIWREYKATFLCHCWMMGQLICKYELFWQEVSVEFLILRCRLRPLCLLLWYMNFSSFRWDKLHIWWGFLCLYAWFRMVFRTTSKFILQ